MIDDPITGCPVVIPIRAMSLAPADPIETDALALASMVAD